MCTFCSRSSQARIDFLTFNADRLLKEPSTEKIQSNLIRKKLGVQKVLQSLGNVDIRAFTQGRMFHWRTPFSGPGRCHKGGGRQSKGDDELQRSVSRANRLRYFTHRKGWIYCTELAWRGFLFSQSRAFALPLWRHTRYAVLGPWLLPPRLSRHMVRHTLHKPYTWCVWRRVYHMHMPSTARVLLLEMTTCKSKRVSDTQNQASMTCPRTLSLEEKSFWDMLR